MAYREKVIRETGELVGVNKHHKKGHFYKMPDGRIYRAMMENNTVYPICSQDELDCSIDKGSVSEPSESTHLCKGCGFNMGNVCEQCCRSNRRKRSR